MAIGAEMKVMAGYIADAGNLKLPDEVLWRAKQHFLDSVASVVGGSARPAKRVIDGRGLRSGASDGRIFGRARGGVTSRQAEGDR